MDSKVLSAAKVIVQDAANKLRRGERPDPVMLAEADLIIAEARVLQMGAMFSPDPGGWLTNGNYDPAAVAFAKQLGLTDEQAKQVGEEVAKSPAEFRTTTVNDPEVVYLAGALGVPAEKIAGSRVPVKKPLSPEGREWLHTQLGLTKEQVATIQ